MQTNSKCYFWIYWNKLQFKSKVGLFSDMIEMIRIEPKIYHVRIELEDGSMLCINNPYNQNLAFQIVAVDTVD